MSPKKNTYHHGDLRRRLIRTAEDLIAKQGMDAVTMRLLSRKIGVSHTAAYRHFRDKSELLCALAENGFLELEKRFQGLSPDLREKPLEWIAALGKTYIDFALENPSRYRTMFGDVLMNERQRPQLNQAVSRAFAHLLSAIEQGQQSGVFRSGNPQELASMSWSMVHGFSHLAIDGQLQPTLTTVSRHVTERDLGRLIQMTLDALVAGLVPENDREGREVDGEN